MGRIMIITVATIFIMIACWLTNFMPLHGDAAFDIVLRFPVPIMPSQFVLFYWIVVYIALFYWIFVNVRHSPKAPHINRLQTVLYTLTCIANFFTFMTWQQQLYILSVLFALLAVCLILYMYQLYPIGDRSWSGRLPISLFFSFLMCLFIWEFSFVLTYYEWQRFGMSIDLWSVVTITIVALLALVVRYFFDDPAFVCAFIWLFICIVIEYGWTNLFVSTAALFLAFALFVAMRYGKRGRHHI
ncbi:hypothetical protein [Caryophanon tenue]|uniref:Tryptophan-rich sensory protein n=1 Tax=Caryophanon tenue TaxID=33978 RepID=A0A1C0YIE9_9BACL|nr:hypothetical protein [Caryophanon tenue]OCS86924.1 hypothetical protein A6M13_12045 [Caryophanon tenue]